MARKKVLGTKNETRKCENTFPVSDCRSYGVSADIQPWTAICSIENWGDDAVSPHGLPDGDTGRYEYRFVPLEDIEACDIHGRPMDEDQIFSGDFFDETFLFEEHLFFDDEDLKIHLEAEVDCVIDSAEELISETDSFLKMKDMIEEHYIEPETYSTTVIDEAEYAEFAYSNKRYFSHEEEYLYAKKRKNSPFFSRAGGDSAPNYSQETNYYLRNRRRYMRRNGDAYKKKRKGGGSLGRNKTRKFGMALLTSLYTCDLLCKPRVAVVNGVPERFFKTKRRQI